MARGWESKSVESQQQDAREAKAPRRTLTAEEREQHSRRSSLELALASTQAELQAACRPAHREMLQLKLAAIHEAVAALGPDVTKG